MQLTTEERFYSKVQINNQTGCWEWVGSKTKDGYGQFRLGKRIRAPHQISWEWYYGALIPPSMEIDHTCRIRHCVNPDHLQLVVQGFNGKQGGLSNGQKQKNRTHCKRGHEFTPENTYVYPDGRRLRQLRCRQAKKNRSHFRRP